MLKRAMLFMSASLQLRPVALLRLPRVVSSSLMFNKRHLLGVPSHHIKNRLYGPGA
jgi:hypothetical protein